MPDLIYLLAVLVCPVGMGVMMLVMMRGNHGNHPTGAARDEVAELRAEVERLRSGHSGDSRPDGQAPTAS